MECYPEICERTNPAFIEFSTFINTVSHLDIFQKIRLENTCFNTDEKFDHFLFNYITIRTHARIDYPVVHQPVN